MEGDDIFSMMIGFLVGGFVMIMVYENIIKRHDKDK